jgi:hypothetical protein
MTFVTPTIPLLDANRDVLATSELEGFCAGEAYYYNEPRPKEAADCRDREVANKSAEEDLTIVQRAACQGAGVAAESLSSCVDFLKFNQYWVTVDGKLTNAWNNTFPYPLVSNLSTQEGDSSRTGDRANNEREGFDR